MRETNRALKYWYNRYNRQFFGGKLPPASVEWAGDYKIPRHGSLFGLTSLLQHPSGRVEWVICIDRFLSLLDVHAIQMVLLHEQNHIYVCEKFGQDVLKDDGDHGPKFEAGMRRLAKIGAFEGLW